MAMSKHLSQLKTLATFKFRFFRQPSTILPLRFLSFATPEEAAAERRRRKRRLRIEPPISSVQNNQTPPSSQKQRQQQQRSPRNSTNPNTPKLPEPVTALTGNRLLLHNRILTLIRENDLDEAALLTRHSIYSNCRPTVFTCNAVMAALLRQSRHAEMLSLHRFITQAGVAPTVITHNLLFQAYCDVRKTDTAMEHFRLLLKDSPVNPSPTTYRILTKGLIDNGKFDQGVELKDDMIARGLVAPDPIVFNTLMSGFVKNQEPHKVLELFAELKDKLGGGTVLDGAVYGNLMKAYFMKGMEKEAMDVYKEVMEPESKVRFRAVSYNSVLDALSKSSKYDEAMHLFNRMMDEHDAPRKITVNVGTFNVMVDGFCTQCRFNEAIEMFRRMGEKKCVPDTLSYNNLIDQLGRNEKLTEAEDLYREMVERGINPDEYTYVLLVEACFKDGRPDDAVGYFTKMLEVGLRPNTNAHNKVIEGMVKTGRVDEAETFFTQMFEREVKPNIRSYNILLQAFCEANRLDDALKVFKNTLMDDGVVMCEEMKELMAEALKKEEREKELGTLYEAVEREKAEALARAEEERARAEAAAREEEERKKAEAAAKAEATSRATRATIEAILGKKKDSTVVQEGEILQPASDAGAIVGTKNRDVPAGETKDNNVTISLLGQSEAAVVLDTAFQNSAASDEDKKK